MPFVAKAIGTPIAKIAARVMAGEKLADLPPIDRDIAYIAVKEAVFPFARFPGIDPVLSPEMKSTGEVMGIADDFATAFLKSQLGAGTDLPTAGTLFVSVKDSDKAPIVAPVRALVGLGFKVDRDRRHRRLSGRAGVPVERVNKVAQGRPHIVDRIKDGGVASDLQHDRGLAEPQGSASIRASALDGRRFPISPPRPRARRWRRAIAVAEGAQP